jgi:nucleotide-binding universal stress UspA family protein
VLDAAAQRATPFGVVAERRIVEGDGANAIIRVAAETASRLIVVGTHHGVGVQALLIGSVTDAVLRASTLPVLTIGRDIQFSDEAHRCFERVLVAIDDSETSEAAIETAFRLPQEDRRKLVFCSVAGVDGESGPARRSLAVAEGITGRALAFARARGIAAHSRVLEGNPREALLIVAAQERADVIILGSHGRRGIDRLLLGSVAESVARTAPLPVLVVPVSGVVGVTKRTAATGGPS